MVVLCTESVRATGGKVLVFCQAGISRSAAICIAYLMQQKRMTMDEAHDYVKSRRTFISPNLNFMRQLHEFDGRLRADRAPSTLDDRPPIAGTPTTAVGPSSPSRPVLRSLQCPVVDQRRRWLSTTPTIPVDADVFPRTTRRPSPVPRYLDANTHCSELSLTVGLGHPAAALLSIVSPGLRLGSASAPMVASERPCRRERPSASTPSQMSRHVFVYPLPLNSSAKSSLVSL